LREGTYHEEVLIEGKAGFLIANYGGEKVTFDGTIPISNWELVDSSTSLYAATDQQAWQLFVDGEPMALARYPNANPWSAEAWNHDGGDGGWLVQADTSTPYHMVDGEGILGDTVHEYLLQVDQRGDSRANSKRSSNSLAAAGVSFNGCPVVLNTGHWDTKVSVVENHTAGSGTFDHADDTSFDFVCCDGDGRYFIEGCEAALDVPGEWTYAADEPGRMLFISPTGGNLGEVRGKIQTYALSFYDNTNIELRGINFFATTIIMYETTDSSVTDCIFMYPSYSRRALGETDSTHKEMDDAAIAPKLAAAASTFTGGVISLQSSTAPLTWFGKKSSYSRGSSNITLARNEFAYTDGAALKFSRCSGDTLEDNLFYNIGYSAAGEYGALNFGNSGFETLRRNSFITTGGSETIVIGKEGTLAEFNYFYDTGNCQSDGAAIHAYTAGQDQSIYRFNWVMNSPRGGFRFDSAKTGKFGSNGTIHHNVAFNNKYYGFQVKGHVHKIYHNTGVEDQYMDICLARCYPATCEMDGEPAYEGATAYNNQNSTLMLNVGKISSKTAAHTAILPPWDDTDDEPPADYSPTVEGNIDTATRTELSVNDMYMGPYVGDWRPRAGSVLVDQGFTIEGINDGAGETVGAAPDIGAYEFGASSYWIPGRQTLQASMPVPFDGVTDVNPDASLMFLGGTNAASHNILFAKAGETLESIATLAPPANIKELSDLELGTTYNWRVDVVDAEGNNVEGPVWSFTTLQFATASFAPSHDTFVHKNNGGTEVFGDSDMLVVQKYNNGKPVRMTFLKFDLSIGLRLATFQAVGYQLFISSASLKLYLSKDDIPDLTLWAVSDTTWDESTMNYNTMPEIGEELWSTTETLAAGTWVTIPLGSYISDLSGSVAFALTTTSTNSATRMRFSSKEGDNPPALDVDLELKK
jgi:hypothetical protein